MPTSHTGNASTAVAPDTAPEAGGNPTIQLPADGDPPNASTFEQAYKDLANWLSFCLSPFAKAESWTQAIKKYKTAFLKHSRFGIDHLGFPAGRIISWQENWDESIFVDGNGATPFLRGWTIYNLGGVISGGDPVTSRPTSRRLEFLNGSTSGNYSYISKNPPCNFDAGNHIALEFDACLETAHPADVIYELGLMTQVPAAVHSGASGFGWFWKGPGSANWLCETRDGSTASNIDSGVAATTSWTRFRIEWHGGSVSENGAQRMLFFINGNLVANKTTNLPIADSNKAARPVFGIRNNSGVASASDKNMWIGSVRFSSNLYAADVF